LKRADFPGQKACPVVVRFEAKRGGAEVAEEDAEKEDGDFLLSILRFSAALPLRSPRLRVSMDLHRDKRPVPSS